MQDATELEAILRTSNWAALIFQSSQLPHVFHSRTTQKPLIENVATYNEPLSGNDHAYHICKVATYLMYQDTDAAHVMI